MLSPAECCFYVADGYFGRPEPTTERERWQQAQMEIWTEVIDLTGFEGEGS